MDIKPSPYRTQHVFSSRIINAIMVILGFPLCDTKIYIKIDRFSHFHKNEGICVLMAVPLNTHIFVFFAHDCIFTHYMQTLFILSCFM